MSWIPSGSPDVPPEPSARAAWARVALVYLLAAGLSYPVLELVLFGKEARIYAVDVFDDGCMTRLGALRLDWQAHGPVLWNPHLTGGNAYLAQFTASPLAIDALIAFLASPFLAYVLCLTLMAWFAGLSIHLFLEQSVGLPRIAAFAGGLIYIFGYRNYGTGFSAVLFPLLLWMSDRAERRGGRLSRRIFPRVFIVAFLLYNFSAQAALLAAGLQLIYEMACAVSASERRSRLASWVFVWSLGLMLYAPVLTTQMKLLPESVRAIRNDRAWMPDTGAALKAFAQHYSDTLVGRPTLDSVGMPYAEPGYGTWYPGLVALVILALSIGLPRANRRERFLLWLLLIIPALDLLAMTIAVAMQPYLGVLRSFQFTRVRLFWPFALAANVAVAFACISRRATPIERPARFGRRLLWLAVAGLVGIQGALCARMLAYIVRHYGGSIADGSARERFIAYIGATAYFAVAGVLILALILLRSPRIKNAIEKRRDGKWASGIASSSALVLAALIVERLGYARIEAYVEHGNIASFEEALEQTPAIRFLLAQPNPDSRRTLTLGDHRSRNRRDHPNRLMFQGLLCADGYENVYPLSYHGVFALLTKPHLDIDPYYRNHFHDWGQRAYAWGPELNPALASLMGIRWLYARGVRVDDSMWRSVFEAGDERVFENDTVFPRGFLVTRLEQFETRKAVLARLQTATIQELRSTAFVESGGAELIAEDASHSDTGQASIVADEVDRVVFRVRSAVPAALIVTDTYVPGWEASVNRAPQPILVADSCFRAVVVPAGESEVELAYRPAYTYRGLWIAVMGLVVLFVLVVLDRFRRDHKAQSR